MNLVGLLPLVEALPSMQRLIQALSKQAGLTVQKYALGAPESARPAIVAALLQFWPGPVVWVAAGPERARLMQEELGTWTGAADRLHYFAAPDALFYDRTHWEPETIRQRIAVLSRLADRNVDGGRPPIVVTSAWALMPKTLPAALLCGAVRALEPGQFRPPAELVASWMRFGYQPVSVVEEPGTFSVRGGIVDVYPPNLAEPVRIELFGDEIDSLRSFDPATQRSGDRLDRVRIVPACEAFMSQGAQAAASLRRNEQHSLTETSVQRLERDAEQLEAGQAFPGVEYYLPYLYPQPASLLDYLGDQALIIVDDLLGVRTAVQAMESQAADLRAALVSEGELPADWPVPYFEWSELETRLGAKNGLSLGYDAPPDELRLEEDSFQAGARYGGRMNQAFDDLKRLLRSGGRAVVVSRQAARLCDLLEEMEFDVIRAPAVTDEPPPGSLTLVHGSLSEGWSLGRGKLAVLTDAELFGWRRSQPRRRKRRRATAPETAYADLRDGEYVVHMDHGVGVYRGLVRKVVGDVEREYLQLEYAGGDTLFVPVPQVDRVTRYSGGEEHEVTLQRLGTADWAQIKSRTRRAVESIARDLLDLYATREVVTGFAFPADGPWQLELETSFPYTETEDQLRALQEVKRDMEQAKPMDRLICGDVGYGKTEVALRAAFKAVTGGRQVAVLVPTTVLAQQHYYTFDERLRAFPVRVEMLSRFRTREEQRDIVDDLVAGKIDIIIGTHRLLQRDVRFRDLGLVIIDEEQRFGVGHKERLKQLRREVDVLTLTATPIPRTLYMSLTGARDMSTINTPPEDRLPVRTQVTEYDDALVRKAILRELDRGGQVFFVHNRVQGIYQIANHLKDLVPEATFAVGHGQMDEGDLARVMLDFSAGRYDVLVCTTIIESGLDIPNVNTMIINRADRFGLAQLYQLRGRVGRSSNRAYAYLLYNRRQRLTPVAQRRLETLLEASELGAGFQVAMRDLEIRGAGEILGAQQHGHMVAVGFDLYCRMLSQAVRRLKAERAAGEAGLPMLPLAVDGGPIIDLPLSAHLPQGYVPEESLRLRLYRRLAEVHEQHEIDELSRELAERFGPPPPAVQNLLYLLRLKALATQAGLSGVTGEGREVVLRFPDLLSPAAIRQAQRFGRKVKIGRNRISLEQRERWRELLVAVLLMLAEAQSEPAAAA